MSEALLWQTALFRGILGLKHVDKHDNEKRRRVLKVFL